MPRAAPPRPRVSGARAACAASPPAPRRPQAEATPALSPAARRLVVEIDPKILLGAAGLEHPPTLLSWRSGLCKSGLSLQTAQRDKWALSSDRVEGTFHQLPRPLATPTPPARPPPRPPHRGSPPPRRSTPPARARPAPGARAARSRPAAACLRVERGASCTEVDDAVAATSLRAAQTALWGR